MLMQNVKHSLLSMVQHTHIIPRRDCVTVGLKASGSKPKRGLKRTIENCRSHHI